MTVSEDGAEEVEVEGRFKSNKVGLETPFEEEKVLDLGLVLYLRIPLEAGDDEGVLPEEDLE